MENRDSKDGERENLRERDKETEQEREVHDSNMSSITQDCLNVYIDINIYILTWEITHYVFSLKS